MEADAWVYMLACVQAGEPPLASPPPAREVLLVWCCQEAMNDAKRLHISNFQKLQLPLSPLGDEEEAMWS